MPADHRAPARRFDTTRWSRVLEAAEGGTEALESLCRDYWPPLHSFVRTSGWSEEEAEDLTQGFFLQLLARKDLEGLDPDRGRLRSFLLASLRNFLANHVARRDALKRPPARGGVPLDDAPARASAPGLVDDRTPRDVFERQWARRVLERALARLREECRREMDPERVELLSAYLAGDRGAPPQAETADRLGMSVGAVRAALHRLRRRFGRCLRAEVAETVARPEDVDDELRHLLSLFE